METDFVNYQISKSSNHQILLPLAYFPPISYLQLMLRNEQTVFDLYENFHKQYYYNRCLIYGPNGILKLSIPILHKQGKAKIKDVRISYQSEWRTLHWRTLEGAYRRSPYFEFYEDYFAPLFSDFKPVFLIDWNLKLLEILNKVLGINLNFTFTNEYIKSYQPQTPKGALNETPLETTQSPFRDLGLVKDNITDCRVLAAPSVLSAQKDLTGFKNLSGLESFPTYQQVFQERHGFIPNLSIIDLLFCEGNHSLECLKNEIHHV